jgi:glycosyltransferase involved in cell wall biosynthesis
MNKSPLVIINNEKIFEKDNGFYCNNIDLKVIPEGLSNYHETYCIFRKSSKIGNHQINIKNINVASNIFNFIYFILKTFKYSNASYLLISITPYTFFSFLLLFIFRKKIFTYLRSSGHEEYRYILGRWSVWIYDFMYRVVTSNSDIISVHSRLIKKKGHLIHPSRIDSRWLQNQKEVSLDKIKFLYVGRINPEKGITEFINIFTQTKVAAELTIVGDAKKLKVENSNINIMGYISKTQSLINTYDDHNIIILPSYTEAHPYVVDECLSRRRPMIIFEEISYISQNRKGVFISKRNIDSFMQTTNYIMKNYKEIQKNIEKNTLYTKDDMIKSISNILYNKS